jgi:phage gpG-like protein
VTTIRVHVRGDDANGLAEELMRELRPRMGNAVLAGVLILEGAVKEELSRPGTGRVYERGETTHQASAPGQPPAVDTGRLRNSITHAGPTWQGDSVEAEVGTNVEYAAVLEYGGTTGKGGRVRLAPRPFMRPALERAESQVDAAMEAML